MTRSLLDEPNRYPMQASIVRLDGETAFVVGTRSLWSAGALLALFAIFTLGSFMTAWMISLAGIQILTGAFYQTNNINPVHFLALAALFFIFIGYFAHSMLSYALRCIWGRIIITVSRTQIRVSDGVAGVEHPQCLAIDHGTQCRVIRRAFHGRRRRAASGLELVNSTGSSIELFDGLDAESAEWLSSCITSEIDRVRSVDGRERSHG